MRRAAAALLGLALLAPATAGAQAVARFDPAVHVEVPLLFLHRPYVSAPLLAVQHDGAFHLPLLETLTRLQVDHRFDARAARITGFYLSETSRYSIDVHALTAQHGNRSISIDTADVLLADLEVYVRAELLERLFGWRVRVSASAMAVEVTTADELPVTAGVRRRRRLEEEQAGRAGVGDVDVAFPRQRSLLAGAMLEYQLAASRAENTLQLRGGLELLGGDFELSGHGRRRGDAQQFTARDVRWRYYAGETPLLTQVTLGTLRAGGPQPRAVQGIEITNRPLEPRRVAGSHVVEGEAEPGWEIELIVNGRTFASAVVDGTGRYRFDVPLGYGATSVRVRRHGPGGELREDAHELRVPFAFVPPGAVDYSLIAGRTRDGTHALHATTTIGLASWLSARAGTDYTRGDSTTLLPWAALSARVAGHNVGVEAAPHAHYRTTLEAVLPGQRTLFASYTDHVGDVARASARRELNTRVFAPFRFAGAPVTLRASHAARELRTTGWYHASDAELAAALRRVRPGIGWRSGSGAGLERREVRLSAHTSMSGARAVPAPLRSLLVRGAFGYDVALQRASDLQLAAFRSFGGNRTLDATWRRDFASRRDALDVRVSIELGAVRTSVTAQRAGSSVSTALHAGGVVALEPRTGQLLFSGRSTGALAGATIRAFIDENGNERRDPGEAMLPARVRFDRAADTRVRADGTLQAGSLAPYRRYTASIDATSLPNPMLGSRLTTFAFVADPNRIKSIDVPFYVGGAVDGTVLRDVAGEHRPVPGLRVHVRSSDGAYEAIVPVFADGSFHQLGLPPGRYTAQVDAAQLGFLGVTAAPCVREFVVRATSDGDFVEGIDFLLITAEPSAPACRMP